MADNETSREDRQLAPSAKKLHKARTEGQVPRSRDLSHALVLGAALGGLIAFGPALGARALELVGKSLRFTRVQAIDTSQLSQWLGMAGTSALWILVPCCLVLALAGAASTMIPGGPVLTTKPLDFNFGRLDPIKGLGRIFSKDSLVDLARLGALAAALTGLAIWFAASHLDRYVALGMMPLPAALSFAHEEIAAGIGLLVGLLATAASIDVPLQWWRHRRNLRMTHQEAREEFKEAEGDPHVRGRIRGRQREISRGRMLAAVPAADVVLTNPTHYAVAIRYDESGMGAPRVVAKGADHLAAKIREIAMDAGVPLFEAPPLARALYAHVEVDREIPAALYTAVAQVLAYVYQLRNYVPGRGTRPRAPQELQVPPELDPKEAAE
jgi:flagellar biosynthetic protein FlhB